MDAQTVSQTSAIVRQARVRYRWPIMLGLLIAVAMLVAYRFTTVSMGSASTVDRTNASLVRLAQQRMLGYLRAHVLVQPLPTSVVPLDPAQRSVADYLRAHDSVDQSPAFWVQAAQAVRDYVRAHTR